MLYPPDNALIEGDDSTVLLSWITIGHLKDDIYYVVHLTDDTGQLKTFPTHAASYRLPAEMRPNSLTTYSWYVLVMQEIGYGEDGIFYGQALSTPSQTRIFRWR